jgi:gliding motility-associated-like protein
LRGRVCNIIIILFLLSAKAYATHIVGGEIYYTCLGSNNYKIVLKIYRDCTSSTGFDNPAHIAIYKSNGILFNQLDVTLIGPNPVPPYVISPCLVPPANICVEEAIYEVTVNLPPAVGGYNIVYQRCCRNGTITNLLNPGDLGSTYMAHVPDPALATCNSSPRFSNFPPIFLCSNVSFNFDHVASDPDGDSLVYSFCDPFSGASDILPNPDPPDPPPYGYVDYLNGYTSNYPIDANPAFTINSTTGFLTGTPTAIGQYVVGVCVNEYRNGVLLSTNKRDFQFNILFCDAAIASIPAQTLFCTGYNVDFTGAASINSNTYFWDFGDLTTTTDTSSLVSTSYTYPDSGIYNVMLVAYDPVGNCYDTAYSNFEVYPLLEPSFVSPPAQCFENNSFNFNAGGDFTTDATFLWDFGGSAIPNIDTLKNPTNIQLGNLGNNDVSLTISQYGCSETFTTGVTTIQKPTATISDVNQYCVGYQIYFQNNSTNSTSWHWDFGINGLQSDTSMLFIPQYTYPDSGIYTVTLIATNDGVCSDTAQLSFWVYPLLNPLINGTGNQCLEDNHFNFEAAGAYTTDATFDWNFGPTASIPQTTVQHPQQVVFSQLGYYPIVLTVSQYGCTKSISDSVGLFPDPEAKFELNGGYGCSPVYVQFIDKSESTSPLIYNWNLGDNNSINIQNPSYSYLQPGTYTVSLTVISNTGCIDTSTFVYPNAVNVVAFPIAGITAEPMEASIFSPEITFSDTSQLGSYCALRISDGTYIEDCNYMHTFKDTGYFKVTQIVKNELNCTDSISITVYIYPEYRMFIPDAFSPNADGLNDIFKPSTIGLKEYDIEIYDRWGEQIFQSNGSQEGWDGSYRGVKSPQGVYVYLLKVVDIKGQSHSYNGKVVLVR